MIIILDPQGWALAQSPPVFLATWSWRGRRWWRWSGRRPRRKCWWWWWSWCGRKWWSIKAKDYQFFRLNSQQSNSSTFCLKSLSSLAASWIKTTFPSQINQPHVMFHRNRFLFYILCFNFQLLLHPCLDPSLHHNTHCQVQSYWFKNLFKTIWPFFKNRKHLTFYLLLSYGAERQDPALQHLRSSKDLGGHPASWHYMQKVSWCC